MNQNRSKTIGILGGGQLSRMLAEAALDMGVRTQILLGDHEDSARGLKGVGYFGLEGIRDFAKSCDVLCFESEFFASSLLGDLIEANPELKERPSQKSLEVLRDKLDQKKVFQSLGLPQARFEELDSSVRDLNSLLDFASQSFPEGCVLKRAFGGYDGKGNYFLSREKIQAFRKKDSEYAAEEKKWLLGFVEEAHREGSRLYLEAWVNFDRELACVAFPSKSDVDKFPLVETFQEKGVCREVWGPESSETLISKVEKFMAKIAKTYPDLGVFALECFEVKGELLINEMAPRVHNSAHYSRLYPYQSQFHAHIACLMDLPFKRSVQSVGHFVMRNVLGPEGWNLETPPEAGVVFEDVFEGVGDRVWYHKAMVKGLRKMGHVSLQVESEDHIESMRAHLKGLEETFWNRVRELAQSRIKGD